MTFLPGKKSPGEMNDEWMGKHTEGREVKNDSRLGVSKAGLSGLTPFTHSSVYSLAHTVPTTHHQT